MRQADLARQLLDLHPRRARRIVAARNDDAREALLRANLERLAETLEESIARGVDHLLRTVCPAARAVHRHHADDLSVFAADYVLYRRGGHEVHPGVNEGLVERPLHLERRRYAYLALGPGEVEPDARKILALLLRVFPDRYVERADLGSDVGDERNRPCRQRPDVEAGLAADELHLLALARAIQELARHGRRRARIAMAFLALENDHLDSRYATPLPQHALHVRVAVMVHRIAIARRSARFGQPVELVVPVHELRMRTLGVLPVVERRMIRRTFPHGAANAARRHGLAEAKLKRAGHVLAQIGVRRKQLHTLGNESVKVARGNRRLDALHRTADDKYVVEVHRAVARQRLDSRGEFAREQRGVRGVLLRRSRRELPYRREREIHVTVGMRDGPYDVAVAADERRVSVWMQYRRLLGGGEGFAHRLHEDTTPRKPVPETYLKRPSSEILRRRLVVVIDDVLPVARHRRVHAPARADALLVAGGEVVVDHAGAAYGTWRTEVEALAVLRPALVRGVVDDAGRHQFARAVAAQKPQPRIPAARAQEGAGVGRLPALLPGDEGEIVVRRAELVVVGVERRLAPLLPAPRAEIDRPLLEPVVHVQGDECLAPIARQGDVRGQVVLIRDTNENLGRNFAFDHILHRIDLEVSAADRAAAESAAVFADVPQLVGLDVDERNAHVDAEIDDAVFREIDHDGSAAELFARHRRLLRMGELVLARAEDEEPAVLGHRVRREIHALLVLVGKAAPEPIRHHAVGRIYMPLEECRRLGRLDARCGGEAHLRQVAHGSVVKDEETEPGDAFLAAYPDLPGETLHVEAIVHPQARSEDGPHLLDADRAYLLAQARAQRIVVLEVVHRHDVVEPAAAYPLLPRLSKVLDVSVAVAMHDGGHDLNLREVAPHATRRLLDNRGYPLVAEHLPETGKAHVAADVRRPVRHLLADRLLERAAAPLAEAVVAVRVADVVERDYVHTGRRKLIHRGDLPLAVLRRARAEIRFVPLSLERDLAEAVRKPLARLGRRESRTARVPADAPHAAFKAVLAAGGDKRLELVALLGDLFGHRKHLRLVECDAGTAEVGLKAGDAVFGEELRRAVPVPALDRRTERLMAGHPALFARMFRRSRAGANGTRGTRMALGRRGVEARGPFGNLLLQDLGEAVGVLSRNETLPRLSQNLAPACGKISERLLARRL